MSTGINVTKPIKILDEGVQLTADVSQIDFTGGVTATTVGNNVTVNVPAAGITVGTTPVTSGTDTRVFFQAGGVVQQDANFTFDNTLKRLTLKAGGATASDIPFVVRNSTDTENILACYGNELTIIGRNASNEPRLLINRAGTTKMTLGGTTDLNIQFPNSGYGQLNSGAQGWDIISTSGDIRTRNSSTYTLLKGNFFGVGIANPAARLDVKAQGALSTDIAFRVRNSADTYNTVAVRGNGVMDFQNPTLGSTYLTIGQIGAGNSADGFLDFALSRGIRSRYGGVVQTGIRLFYNSTSRTVGFYVSSSEASGDNTIFFDGGQNIRIGQGYSNTNQPDVNATRTIQQMTGVAPTTSVADGFQQYSADITAGNAAPHFRTENGAIVKVYQETTAVAAATLVGNAGTNITDTDTFDGYTIQQIVKALRNQGLLA